MKLPVKKVYDFLLYSLAFVLLMEWLLPLPYITDTGFIFVFVLATFVFFAVNFLQLPVVLTIAIKLFVMLAGLHYMFFDGPIWEWQWMSVLFNDVLENMIYLLTGNIVHLTDLFRSLLFFILLAAMSHLLYFWVVRVKRIFVFLIITVTFVAVLDTFTPYDATLAIIRIFIIGFLLLGLMRLLRTLEEGNIVYHSKWLFARVVLSLGTVIVAASSFGYIAPKLEPQWADPVPYVLSFFGLEHSWWQQKVGYGDNDERLGGGFVHDNTPIFYANVEKEQYFRGETKNYYSGKGWEVTTPEQWHFGPMGTFEENVGLIERKAEIYFTGNETFSHLFYPGEIKRLTTRTDLPLSFSYDWFTLKTFPSFRGGHVQLDEYVLVYAEPQFSIDALRKAKEEDPDWIQEYYLQLPDTLPERIRELAAEITAPYDNRYDKAKAVERYLSGPLFTYDTKNVAIPAENEDYVDQFLFETRRGYCDNFSTAMAIMLRTIDIPTRWVKGFAGGERLAATEEVSQYLITSANAHSWVEVYFPGHGWVPFEPTKGFYQANAFSFGQSATDDRVMENERDTDAQERNEPSEQKEEGKSEKENDKKTMVPRFGIFAILAAILGLTVFSVVFWKKRTPLRRTFADEFDEIILLLEEKGLCRLRGETLREYALRIDRLYEAETMQRLIEKYEQYSYGKEKEFVLTEEERELLAEMKKKILS